MALKPAERAAIIADLVANCDAWSGEGDDKILATFSDAKLINLKKSADAVAVANRAVEGIEDKSLGVKFRYDPEKNEWQRAKLTNAAPAAKKATPAGQVADEEEEEEDETPTPAKGKKATPMNATPTAPKKANSVEELSRLGLVSPELAAKLLTLNNLEGTEKEKLATKIVRNSGVPHAERQGKFDWLMNHSLADLTEMASLVREQPTDADLAAQAAALTNATPGKGKKAKTAPAHDADALGLPSMEWQTMNGETTAVNADPESAPFLNDEETEGEPLEKLLNRLRPQDRQVVQNGLQLQERRRQELIDALLANVTSPEESDRLAAVLNTKRLDELEALSSLAKVEKKTQKNWYGGSGGPATTVTNSGGGRGAFNENEDILAMPAIDWAAEAKKA